MRKVVSMGYSLHLVVGQSINSRENLLFRGHSGLPLVESSLIGILPGM